MRWLPDDRWWLIKFQHIFKLLFAISNMHISTCSVLKFQSMANIISFSSFATHISDGCGLSYYCNLLTDAFLIIINIFNIFVLTSTTNWKSIQNTSSQIQASCSIYGTFYTICRCIYPIHFTIDHFMLRCSIFEDFGYHLTNKGDYFGIYICSNMYLRKTITCHDNTKCGSSPWYGDGSIAKRDYTIQTTFKKCNEGISGTIQTILPSRNNWDG